MTSTTTVTQADTTTTLVSSPRGSHDDESTIVAAASVVGFILLGLTGLLLFLKISRWLRIRNENRRFAEWNAREHHGNHPKGRHAGRYAKHSHKGKNAFDIIEDDEGIPG